MGACCPKDDTDTTPTKQLAKQGVSPNSLKRGNRREQEVNPFKPGPRDVRIVQDEETGKL